MNKTLFITGASQGIGYETALLFAKNGYNIGFTYFNSEENSKILKNKIESLNVRCHMYKVNVKDYKKMETVIADFISKEKNIDTLVLNAGVCVYNTLDYTSFKEIDEIIDVNIKGVINTAKSCLNYMISEKKGNIITISSIWGITGASCETVYSATKGAIIAFTKALAKELGPSNIRVNSVAPGATLTNMISDFSKEDIEKIKEESAIYDICKPEDIANTVYFLASNNGKAFTGQILSPNMGFLI